jgi:hypothetical protein
MGVSKNHLQGGAVHTCSPIDQRGLRMHEGLLAYYEVKNDMWLFRTGFGHQPDGFGLDL